jgi:ADP-heptose:LPS heptosyltransferase
VRFYFSSSFPDTLDNRAFADSIVRTLASSTHVVMLGPGFRVDDHRDFAAAVSSRIHAVDDLMTPDRNLETQTAVIAGARAFVGTYGGYAYLAPFCNVPAIAFYSNRDGFHTYHLELADRVFRRMNTASLVALDVRDAALLRAALGAAQDQHA